ELIAQINESGKDINGQRTKDLNNQLSRSVDDKDFDKLKENIQRTKIKILIISLPYPNPNSTDAQNSKSILNNKVNNAKTTDLRKSYNHLCEIKRIMNSLNLLSFKWEENGKLMPFDQEVAKRIDVKIYEIGSILANIDSTNCGNPLDDDLKFYNDEVLRDIQARKKQELYDKDFFANLEWELRTCESISLVLSKYCIKYHNWIKEWYNLYRNNDKISLYDFLELKKQEDKQEILDELAIYGIGKEIVDEFINNYYIDIEEDINKNNNFEDHIWSKVKSSNGPKYKLRNPIIELIKQYKEK
ncbi:hypothetical protein, partial [Mycoplasmopsis cynos]|uniref:hypothetical protein n=1 Tax=Mycoplasmopsis cynos TaxID=171284 RepID=UPI001144F2BC